MAQFSESEIIRIFNKAEALAEEWNFPEDSSRADHEDILSPPETEEEESSTEEAQAPAPAESKPQAKEEDDDNGIMNQDEIAKLIASQQGNAPKAAPEPEPEPEPKPKPAPEPPEDDDDGGIMDQDAIAQLVASATGSSPAPKEPEPEPDSQDSNGLMDQDEIAKLLQATQSPQASKSEPDDASDNGDDSNGLMDQDEIAKLLEATQSPQVSTPEPEDSSEGEEDSGGLMDQDEIAKLLQATQSPAPSSPPEPEKSETEIEADEDDDDNGLMDQDEIAKLIAAAAPPEEKSEPDKTADSDGLMDQDEIANLLNQQSDSSAADDDSDSEESVLSAESIAALVDSLEDEDEPQQNMGQDEIEKLIQSTSSSAPEDESDDTGVMGQEDIDKLISSSFDKKTEEEPPSAPEADEISQLINQARELTSGLPSEETPKQETDTETSSEYEAENSSLDRLLKEADDMMASTHGDDSDVLGEDSIQDMFEDIPATKSRSAESEDDEDGLLNSDALLSRLSATAGDTVRRINSDPEEADIEELLKQTENLTQRISESNHSYAEPTQFKSSRKNSRSGGFFKVAFFLLFFGGIGYGGFWYYKNHYNKTQWEWTRVAGNSSVRALFSSRSPKKKVSGTVSWFDGMKLNDKTFAELRQKMNSYYIQNYYYPPEKADPALIMGKIGKENYYYDYFFPKSRQNEPALKGYILKRSAFFRHGDGILKIDLLTDCDSIEEAIYPKKKWDELRDAFKTAFQNSLNQGEKAQDISVTDEPALTEKLAEILTFSGLQ
jgi:hypothetical protein